MYKISHHCISTFVIYALLTLLSFQVFADSPDASREKMTVENFSITPSTVPHRNELIALLADDVGKELTFTELSKLTDRVTRYLRSRGYMVASAYLPAQKAQDGKVEIAVLIGNYDKIIINNNTGVADPVVKNYLASIKTGSIIRKEPLERVVWLLSDLSGVEAKVTLEPGGEVGTSNLIIDLVSQGKSISGSNSFDNYGNKFTGNNEGGISLSLSNPFHRGDSFFVHGLLGSDLASSTISWDMPVAAGHKLALSHSKMNYTLGGQFAALGSSGSATVLGAQWSYALRRSGTSNVNGVALLNRKSLGEFISTGNEADKKSRILALGINGSSQDSWHGRGFNTYSLIYSSGDLDIQTPAARAIDSSTTRTNGRFGKWNLSAARQQLLGEGQYLLLTFSGQLAGKNLDSSEKLALGGAYGVRAYPQGEAAGDEGYLASVEYRRQVNGPWDIPGKWQAAAFLDAGRVTLYDSPFAPGSNNRSLYGLGLGMLYNSSKPGGIACRLNYAWKLGDEKALSDTDKSGRLWVQLAREF